MNFARFCSFIFTYFISYDVMRMRASSYEACAVEIINYYYYYYYC